MDPWYSAVSSEGVSVVKDTLLSETDQAIPWVKTDAKTGDQWEFNTWSQVGGSRVPITGTMSVIGTEEVKVPAGLFTSVRMSPNLAHTGRHKRGGTHPVTAKSNMRMAQLK